MKKIEIDPRFAPIVGALGKLLARAAEGAVEGVLEEVQTKVKEIDTRITNARRKVQKRREVVEDDDNVIEVEVVNPKH